ncbi:hypothetical protein [Aeoliella sp.]|uniref:hypothetical protein n=1 Tax=Aeoliella sp. TaxID=2795800 RepID=UPI003CCC3D5A
MVVWLAFWTAGGAFACYMLYRLFGPCQPEVVVLGRESFFYDSGVLTMDNRLIFHALQHGDAKAIMGRLHGKRTRIELDKQEVGPVTLERVGSRQRLRFDHGADRIEIGLFLREPEREWLAAEIQAWQKT